MPREIMTIQLGGYSNFLGSHFWNIQEECMSYDDDDDESRENSEVRHDILWRATRETVVPRLMTLDLKSERGALRRRGYLYPDEEPAAAGGAHSQTLFHAYRGASNLRQPVLYVCNRLSAWPILFFAP